MDTPSPLHPQIARLEELLSRQDIYDCIKQVSRAIDRFDEELFVSAYHPDAIVDAGAIVADARSAYAVGAKLHEAGQVSTLHHLTNHSCEIDGDMAHAETYFLYVGRNRDDSNWAAGGRYADRLERRDGVWKIAFRCTALEWSGMVPTAEVPLFADVPDLHLNGTSTRSPEDISYRRPLINLRVAQVPDRPDMLGTPKV